MLSLRKFTFKNPQQPAFQYEALQDPQDIRLVEIQPSSNNLTQIECKMITTSLSNSDLSYQCLSYVWGTPDQNRSILCNNRILNVTDNLFVALNNLRQNKATFRMWIDQLCINQEDIAERNKQVMLMAKIYEKAERTIIWIGEKADNSHLAIKLIQSTPYLSVRENLKLFSPEAHGSGTVDQLLSNVGAPKLEDKSWVALRRLLERPWFKRSWVSNTVQSFY
jgi:hypothetical protein